MTDMNTPITNDTNSGNLYMSYCQCGKVDENGTCTNSTSSDLCVDPGYLDATSATDRTAVLGLIAVTMAFVNAFVVW